jgi:AraC-like DNA-binding protein
MELIRICFSDLNGVLSFIPAATALTSFCLIFYSFRQKLPPKENRIRVILLFYLLISLTILFFSGMFNVLEDIIRYILPLSSLGIQLMQVLFYHFISEVTATERKKRAISVYHYYVPVLLLLVQSLFYYKEFSNLGSLKDISHYLEVYFHLTCSLYTLFYAILSWRKVRSYHEILCRKFSGDKGRIHINWLYWLIILRFLYLGCMVLYALNVTITSLVLYVIVHPLICTLLTYHTLLRDYVFVYQDISNSVMTRGGNIMNIRTDILSDLKAGDKEDSPTDNSLIDQKEFEQYFAIHRPYLDMELKITDLLDVFKTNKSYLSRFINEVYGMNFRQYVNSWRMAEMEKLLQMDENQGKSIESLCKQAGFGSVRSYWRCKKDKGISDI